jgi:glycerol kinase
VIESTALGAAYLAGLAVGYYVDKDDIVRNVTQDREFLPQMQDAVRVELISNWEKAVSCSLSFKP